MRRAEWDEYFLRMATLAASRATCPVARVGAVFVNPESNSVLTMGYNGAPRGTQHCGIECENRTIGYESYVCKAVHAEQNAIYNAALNGVKLIRSHVYTTISPCLDCARALIQVGVKNVTFSKRYTHNAGMDMLQEGNININYWSIK
jgi:dCMP deaminase